MGILKIALTGLTNFKTYSKEDGWEDLTYEETCFITVHMTFPSPKESDDKKKLVLQFFCRTVDWLDNKLRVTFQNSLRC
jgi:hypothetical protein